MEIPPSVSLSHLYNSTTHQINYDYKPWKVKFVFVATSRIAFFKVVALIQEHTILPSPGEIEALVMASDLVIRAGRLDI